jgi:O6-methylguanine-DNA--protein-cysteine methyltransferase
LRVISEYVEVVARRARKTALRDTETMTEEMREDLMHMLTAFGLPYIVAPFEAEAQCAVLEEVRYTPMGEIRCYDLVTVVAAVVRSLHHATYC